MPSPASFRNVAQSTPDPTVQANRKIAAILGRWLQVSTRLSKVLSGVDLSSVQYVALQPMGVGAKLIYFDEFARTAGNRLPDFSKIRKTHLQRTGEYVFVFLFHVPSGKKADRFHTATREITLREYDLVAP